MNHLRVAAAASAAGLAVLLAACGDDGGSASDTTTGEMCLDWKEDCSGIPARGLFGSGKEGAADVKGTFTAVPPDLRTTRSSGSGCGSATPSGR